jgi:hypothetical protein
MFRSLSGDSSLQSLGCPHGGGVVSYARRHLLLGNHSLRLNQSDLFELLLELGGTWIYRSLALSNDSYVLGMALLEMALIHSKVARRLGPTKQASLLMPRRPRVQTIY